VTAVLEAILDDLQAGLRRRAARRRRARTAGATVLTSAALLAVGISTAGMMARPESAPAYGGGITAARLITGEACMAGPCWASPAQLKAAKERTVGRQ
jgi:hypothetical protein